MKDLLNKIKERQLRDNFEFIIDAIEHKDQIIEALHNEVTNFNLQDALTEKDKEIKSLRNELAHGFGITDEEWEAIHKWQDEHIKEVHNGNSYSGAIGGRWTYEFIPTSLGDIGTVKCSCGAEYTFRELE